MENDKEKDKRPKKLTAEGEAKFLAEIVENSHKHISVMDTQEARKCVDAINSNLRNTRALLLDLYDREGWKALGYESWRACVVKEFGSHQSYLYRQLEAAQTEKNISVSPIGEIPEARLRPLTSLPPEKQRDVYQKAVETAPEGKVTARHVENTVKQIVPKVDKQKNVRAEPELMSNEFRSAFESIQHVLYNERETHWKTTSREVAGKYINQLLRII